MIAAIWLVLSGLMYSLQLSTGSFPKPLTQQEEEHYLQLAAQGDLEARNILIERNWVSLEPNSTIFAYLVDSVDLCSDKFHERLSQPRHRLHRNRRERFSQHLGINEQGNSTHGTANHHNYIPVNRTKNFTYGKNS